MPGQRSWIYKLPRKTSCHLRPSWYNADVISYPVPRKLTWNYTSNVWTKGYSCARCRKRLAFASDLWYTNWRYFDAMSGIPSFDLEFYLEGEMSRPKSCCVKLPWRLAVVWDHFGARAVLISGRYPVPRPLILNFTLKVKCQDKGLGRVSCPVMLDIVWVHIGKRASWSYPKTQGHLTLSLTL